tara:strand:+ start:10321 stop:11325 length:1005 start_codon:yes stop_codon:yes gene_type:complete
VDQKNINISSLDLFRGLAGYGVAICHYFYYLYNFTSFQFYSIFFVELFFVLSGFVLFPQLQKVYNNLKNTKIFFIRRWLRTIPPYVIALICYSILFNKFDTDTIKYLFFIQKASESFIQEDYFSVAWSLSVEEYFYLLFPLFLFFLNKKKFLHVTFIFIFLIYFFKIAYLFTETDEEFYRIGTFLRLDSIAFGIILRIYFNKINNYLFNIASLILILFSMKYFFDKMLNLSNFDLFLFVLLTQFFSVNMIIIFINFNKFIKNQFIIRIFSLLSKQTYSIYLFHLLFVHFFEINKYFSNSGLLFIYYLVTLFLFSSIFYYFVEKKIMDSRPKYIS